MRPLAIGCDLGGTNLKTALLRGGRVLDRESRPVPRGSAQEIARFILENLDQGLERLALRSRGGVSPAPALGVSVPGFLDAARRRIVHLSHLPSLDGYPLARWLERRLGRRVQGPVVLDTDTNAGALAEALRGHGRGARRVLYLSVGTGLGAALVVAGEVVRVSHHTVGQVAHLPLGRRGPRCSCGRRGCAESLLAARGICWRARQAGVSRRDGQSPEALVQAARDGCALARAVLAETGELLGELLALLANFLSPERLVIGGGIAAAEAHLLPAARRQLRRRVQPQLRDHVELTASRWGSHAGAVGMALAAVRGGGGRA